MGYDCEILYMPGKSNQAADALSREYVGMIELCSMISLCGVLWEQVQPEVDNDKFIQGLRQDFIGAWYSVLQREVSNTKTVCDSEAVATEYHDSPMGGQSGDFKTYQRLASEWFWQGMRWEVAKYVQACTVCQQQKASTLSPGVPCSRFLFLNRYGRTYQCILWKNYLSLWGFIPF